VDTKGVYLIIEAFFFIFIKAFFIFIEAFFLGGQPATVSQSIQVNAAVDAKSASRYCESTEVDEDETKQGAICL
jgi:hypothetical protein